MSFDQYIILGTAVANIGIAIYIFSRKPSSTLHRAFFLFGIGTALWSGGIGLLPTGFIPHIEQFIFLGGGIMSVSIFALSCMLGRREQLSRPALIGVALFVASFIGVPLGWYVVGIVPSDGSVAPVFGPMGQLFVGAICAYMLAGVGRLIVTARHLERSRRPPVHYFLLGAAIFTASTVIFDAVLPLLGIVRFNFLGPLSLLPFVGITGYAIVRHQLLDIRIVLQRGLVYSGLFGTIIACYLALLFGISFVFNEAYLLAAPWSAGITTLVGIFTVPVIEQTFKRWTDKIFFKDKHDHGEVLRALSEALHRNVDSKLMHAEARAVFERVFHPESISFSPSGGVVLGSKRSGEPYTTEDTRLIETFSHQAATAFERARLFQQVKEYATHLEEKVEERTTELRRAQQNQQQMMVDISHNLQTPLTIFQTKLDGLKRTMLDDAEIRGLEHSLAELSTFTYDLLKLARLEHGEALAKTAVDLSAIIAEVAEETATIASAHGIRVVSSIVPGLCIAGDAQQLRDACMNLASNAIKYMRPRGKREILFSLKSGTDTVICTVQDTGIGIRRGDLKHIFERFYRASGGREDVRGSGLGLAIVKRIVECHGGKIHAESTYGRGTNILISLPKRAERR